MRIAITGATGFIGRKLVMKHLALGDQVRILSRRSTDEVGLPDSVQCFHGDLVGESNLTSFSDGVDILYHCAGEITDMSRMESLHVDGTRRLISAASGRIGRWVQLSSVGTYGPQRTGIITEQTTLNPCGVYETTKLQSDILVQSASLDGAFEHVILRPSNVFGTGMPNRSLYGLISMIQYKWFFFIGRRGASANYIHVDNVVDALVLSAQINKAAGQVYNLSDHRTLESFTACIAQSLGCHVPRVRFPELPVRVLAKLLGGIPGMPLTQNRVDALTIHSFYSTEKIERELGYRHLISMEEGLKQLVAGYLQRTVPV